MNHYLIYVRFSCLASECYERGLGPAVKNYIRGMFILLISVLICPNPSFSNGPIAYESVCMCVAGMVISQGSTGKSSWPTCVTASQKPPVKKKVQTLFEMSYQDGDTFDHFKLCVMITDVNNIALFFFKTVRRTVHLCCLCWSGVVSWRLQDGFRLRNWDVLFAACTLEVKVAGGHILSHAS